MPRHGWLARGLVVVSVLVASLMVIAAVNLVLIFVLFSVYHQAGRTDTGLANLLIPMAVGALPFLITAALIAWALLDARGGKPGQQSADSLVVISGIGLPFTVLIGFWIGLAASAHELPVGSQPAAALAVYQFTLLAAVIADVATLVVALLVRRLRSGGRDMRPLSRPGRHVVVTKRLAPLVVVILVVRNSSSAPSAFSSPSANITPSPAES